MSELSDIRGAVRDAARELLAALKDVEARVLAETAAGRDGGAVYEAVRSAVDACVARLAALGLDGPQNQLPSSELWNLAGNVLRRGWLQNQARTKPRGYAGDYEMLARIYENRCCDDPLGRLFDRYFQDEAAPRAVRNRMAMLRDWIVQAAVQYSRRWKVAVVGSALGVEVRDALRTLPAEARARIRVALLDIDPAALDFAREQLGGMLSPDQLQVASGNLFRLPDRRALAAPLAGADLLCCPGLFDYLEDDEAVRMIRLFRESMTPTGVIHIFQFAPHNPTRTYMEWLGNWYLTYRTGEDLARLAKAAGASPGETTISSEPLGVDLLLSLIRSSG